MAINILVVSIKYAKMIRAEDGAKLYDFMRHAAIHSLSGSGVLWNVLTSYSLRYI
jgi:hypothetical protein